MTTLPKNSGNPAINLTVLEEKRRAMRLQALAYLEEADRLDALYGAVTSTPTGSPQPDSNTNPDGDPN